MVSSEIKSVLPRLSELGGQVSEEAWAVIRSALPILRQAAEDAEHLEAMPIAGAGARIFILERTHLVGVSMRGPGCQNLSAN